jgi:hypothetical protein
MDAKKGREMHIQRLKSQIDNKRKLSKHSLGSDRDDMMANNGSVMFQSMAES